ncbi:MAG: DUF1553 domain-containing protein [Limisphaerales bacterium]
MNMVLMSQLWRGRRFIRQTGRGSWHIQTLLPARARGYVVQRVLPFLLLALTIRVSLPARGGEPLKLVSVRVEPSPAILESRWSSLALVVTGGLSDGTTSDLTANAEFAPAKPGIVGIEKGGLITAVGDGETTVLVIAKLGDARLGTEVQATVKNTKDDSVFFLRDVMAAVSRLGCNAAQCHGSTVGKGRLKLAMFGTDPAQDYATLTDSTNGLINKAEPLKSLFLQKPAGSLPHGGGAKLQAGSLDQTLLVQWIVQGARWRKDNEPDLVSLEIVPRERSLSKGETVRLEAVAVFSDGLKRSVTRDARFRSVAGSIAMVDEWGRVKADDFGEAVVVASYLRKSDVARLVVPQPLAAPFPETQPNNKIDDFVFAKLRKLGFPPSPLCTDSEFVRRVYLDLLGTLPAPAEARAFLADADAGKRSKLIDRLLDREEFTDFQALKWGDLLRIKSEYPVNLWPKAAEAYYRWLRQSLAQNKPYDAFVRELITSTGSNFRNGAVNYFRALPQKDPQTIAEGTALVFMGTRLACARCHGHPLENWGLDDNLDLAAFFAQVSYKSTKEWKEEIVFLNPKQVLPHPLTKQVVKPRLPGGKPLELPPEEDPRVKLADWLTSPENPWFARNAVNRVWFWLLGRGIVDEPDDLRPTNPPENPELLDYLAQELIGHKYDLNHIYRLIANSRTYQLSSKPNQWNAKDNVHFSHYAVKRLGAEQFLDALCQVTATSETFSSIVPAPNVTLPPGYRARQLSDANLEHPVLEIFGRPPRDTPYQSERSTEVSLRQELYLINSNEIQAKVANSPWLQQLLGSGSNDVALIEALYFAALSRPPTEEERVKLLEYVTGKTKAALDTAEAAKKAAEDGAVKIRGDFEKAKAECDSAEKAAQDSEKAIADAKAAVAKAEAALADANRAAEPRRQEAAEAKRLEELAGNQTKPVEARFAPLTQAVTDATAAKVAMDKALAEARGAATQAQQTYDAGEKAAQEAAAKVKSLSEPPAKSADEQKQAATEADGKRKAADAAKLTLTQAQQRQQQAQAQADSAGQKLADATAKRKPAEEGLAKVKNLMAAAAEVFQMADKPRAEAEAVVAAAKGEADKAAAALKAGELVAVEKRKLAEQAKASRDKLAGDEKAAAAKSAQAAKDLDAVKAPPPPAQRQQAFRDVLWALLNTKEFLLNH